jgi:hypothetical protein
MPGDVELNVICVGSAEEARSAARRTAPSASKFGQRCRTVTVLFLVRLRLTARRGLRSTSISARVTLTSEQRGKFCYQSSHESIHPIRNKGHGHHDFARALDYPHTFRTRSDGLLAKRYGQ